MNRLRDLDLKLMRVFITVVESGGFAQAQEALNYAPSTLSEQIKDLELRVGFTVCLRGRKGFRLTQQGEELYRAAKRALESIEMVRNQINQIAGRVHGAVKIGVVDGVATDRTLALDEVIKKFCSLHDDVSIQLDVQPPVALETALMTGDIDVGIGPFPIPSTGVSYLKLHKEHQVLFCGKDHSLFGVEEQDLNDSALQKYAYAACDYPSQTKLALRASTVVATMEAMLVQILSGRYIGFLPSHVAEPWVKQGRLWPLAPTRLSYDAQFMAASRSVSVEDTARRDFLRLLSGRFAK